MNRKSAALLVLLSASLSSSVSVAQSPYEYRNRGMTLGAVAGAVTGGVIGDHNDKTLAGAAIGTAVGALAGAAIGDSIDNDIAWRNAAAQQQLAIQLSRAISVQDVIAMSQSRLSDNVIVTQIHTNGVAARPQPADLITMNQAGVSDAVIRAMQTAPLATYQPRPVPVYRDRVIVERYPYPYLPPPYPRAVFYGPPPHYGYPHHYRPGVSWGISIGH